MKFAKLWLNAGFLNFPVWRMTSRVTKLSLRFVMNLWKRQRHSIVRLLLCADSEMYCIILAIWAIGCVSACLSDDWDLLYNSVVCICLLFCIWCPQIIIELQCFVFNLPTSLDIGMLMLRQSIFHCYLINHLLVVIFHYFVTKTWKFFVLTLCIWNIAYILSLFILFFSVFAPY